MYQVTDKQALPWYQKVKQDFPPAKYQCDQNKEIMVPMHDGINLNTRLFIPNADGPYHVLFTRNPYPANEDLCEALYLPFVEQGYCVVIQDCRGTGKSQGIWEPFKNERQDGVDALNWLNEQEWVLDMATFGRSYSGYTQWIVGDMLPNKVKTMFLEVYGINRFDQVYTNGVFREDIYTSWAFGNSGVKSKIPSWKQYQMAIKDTPAENRDKDVLNQRLPFYDEYLREIEPTNDYWKKSLWQTLYDVPEKINVPVVVTDGWADHHLQGSLLGYKRLRPEIKNKSRLIVTPTDHIGNVTGDLDYQDINHFGFMNMRANLDWFNYILKDEKASLDSKVYLMGANRWINYEPTNKNSKYYLNIGQKLSVDASQTDSLSFRYDPTKPVSWPGGNELLAWIIPKFTDSPHGFVKTRPYVQRKDVLSFESQPFQETQVLNGTIRLHLRVSSSKVDTDFSARLCIKNSQGDYINIKDGISSIAGRNGIKNDSYHPDTPITLNYTLGDIAWQVNQGDCLVLLVSSSNFPMYTLHSNRAGLWSKQKITKNVADQTIFVGADSYIELPLEDIK